MENKNMTIDKRTTSAFPEWLNKRKEQMRLDFNSSKLPQRGLHLWRYTDPEKFLILESKEEQLEFGDNYSTIKKIELNNLEENHLCCFVSDKAGMEIESHCNEYVPKNVMVTSLSKVVKDKQNLVDQHLYSLINSSTGKFEALNGTLWQDGIFIYVPKGVVIDKPIHLLRESAIGNSNQFMRLLVVVEENAQVTIVDEYSGGSTNEKLVSNTNSAVEIVSAAGSKTTYIPLQRMTTNANFYLTYRAGIEKDANIVTIPLSFGSNISKSNFGVILNGQGADSNIYGMSFGSDRQHTDNHTYHYHKKSNTTSDIHFKVVLKDKALSAYTGLIKIDQQAKGCEAYQENRNLMLNKGCKAEAIPELEILNEDVMCSHGATIGPIDPEMIFFLMCRGIEKADAVRMIVSGFFESTLSLIPRDIKERVTDYVARRLEQI